MKIYKLPELAESHPERRYLLGSKDLSTDAVYLGYRSIVPRGPEAELTPREGYEEVVYILKGSVRVKCARSEFSVKAGEAFHPAGPIRLDNPEEEEAVYIVAGGRAMGGPSKSEKNAAGGASPSVSARDIGEPSMTATREVECAVEEESHPEFIITTEDSPEKEDGQS